MQAKDRQKTNAGKRQTKDKLQAKDRQKTNYKQMTDKRQIICKRQTKGTDIKERHYG